MPAQPVACMVLAMLLLCCQSVAAGELSTARVAEGEFLGTEGRCVLQGRVTQHTQVAEHVDPNDVHQVPFEWAKKSENSDSELYKAKVQGKCLTIFDCEGAPVSCNCPNAPQTCENMEQNSYHDLNGQITENDGILTMIMGNATMPDSICYDHSGGSHNCTKYGVAAGPYAITNQVEVKRGDVASYTIKAEMGLDDYELYAGLYAEDGTLVDYQFFRGERKDWETFELTSPATAKYHAEFWLASYDRTGGCVVGSLMEIKDVKSTKSAKVCANVRKPVEVVFLVDESWSVTEDGFDTSKEYVKKVVSELHVGAANEDTRIAVVTFSGGVKVQSHLDQGTSKDAIYEKVENMPYNGGSTCTATAMQKVREDVFTTSRQGAQKMLVILTDGNPTCGGPVSEESEIALSEGIDILAVGVGSGITHENLISMTRNEDKVLKVDKYENLVSIVRATSIMICEEAGGQVEVPKQTLPSLTWKGWNPSGKLQLCEGDCDSDDNCEGELKCFQRHGYTPVSGCAELGEVQGDYCYDPASIILSLKEIDGTFGQETQLQLGRCEGDCDKDSECKEGLVCFQRNDEVSVPNCRGAGKPDWDYCHLPDLTELGLDPKDYPEGNPALAPEGLGRCQGDCDKDSECADGLKCFQRDDFEEVPGCKGQGVEKWDYCYNSTVD